MTQSNVEPLRSSILALVETGVAVSLTFLAWYALEGLIQLIRGKAQNNVDKAQD